MTTLQGTVTRVFFAGDKFSAGKLQDAQGSEHSFKASFRVDEGAFLSLSGDWTTDPKWGKQFAASTVDPVGAIRPEAIEMFLLRNPRLKNLGIGPKKKKVLVQKFGIDLPDMCSRFASEIIAELPPSTADQFCEIVNQDFSGAIAQSFLCSLGLNTTVAKALIDKHGSHVVDIVRRDPWMLVSDVRGLGFKTCDDMARKWGSDMQQPSRAVAALLDILRAAVYTTGHTAISAGQLAEGMQQRVADMDQAVWVRAYNALQADGKIIVEAHGATNWIGLAEVKAAEEFVIEDLTRRGKTPQTYYVSPDKSGLNEQQATATGTAFERLACVIAGGAGVGKTHTIKRIIDACERSSLRCQLVAPTGKAAKRMTEATQRNASTIHMLLGAKGANSFEHDRYNQIAVDMVIVDECSMVDVLLFSALLEALPHECAVVLVGDDGQLLPVGPGAVFRDLLAHDIVPIVRLTQTMRQAGTLKHRLNDVRSGIFHNATIHEEGRSIPPWVIQKVPADRMMEMATRIRFERVPANGYDPIDACVVLAAKKDGALGVHEINKAMQERAHGMPIDMGFWPGDPVIQTRNDYRAGVMNGEIGKVQALPGVTRGNISKRADLCVRFEEDRVPEGWPDVMLAYCLTIHKSQGSEYPIVIVMLPSSHVFQYARELLYTAMSRARIAVIVLSDAPEKIQGWLQRQTGNERQTWERVRHGGNHC